MKKIVVMILGILILSGCKSEKIEERKEINTVTEPMIKIEEIADADFSDVDNTPSGWGLKKNKGEKPDISQEAAQMFRKYNTFYMDENGGKVLYLTFDEGYENGYTAQILDVLKECEVPAAFFVTGPYIKNETALIERMISEGHIVGNHTVNHPNLPGLVSAEKMAQELCALNERFLTQYGVPLKYMRPPEGVFSERLLKVADTLGYKTIFWSFAYKDWDPKTQKGEAYAFREITPYIHDGAILLLHAVSKDNADSLKSVITYAKQQGYEFKSLDELEMKAEL